MADLPRRMQACRIHAIASFADEPEPLRLEKVRRPVPGPGDVLIRVLACGVCHTELDEIEGRTPPPVLPVIPGHQVVGEVVAMGDACTHREKGQYVGVAWIHSSCGQCRYCRSGLENLCADFHGCGRDANGGYAEYMTVPEDFALPLPATLDPLQAAPLLCAGAVGLRAIRLCQLEPSDAGQPIGLMGFGASGHLVLQMLRHLYPDAPLCVFARSPIERDFAMELGATWAGDITDHPPKPPVAIIDTTPAWRPVLSALAVLAPGGRLVINAISKEANDTDEWLAIDYPGHLWREKILRTVTNVTRRDVQDCLQLAQEIPLRPEVQAYTLGEANQALRDVRAGGIRGARVLHIADPQVC